MSNMKSLNLVGPCNSLGYGTVGFNLLINLSKQFKIAYWPIGNIDYPVPEHLRSVVQDSLNNQADYDPSAPCIRVWHQHDLAQFVGRGTRIGFPIFELDKFNEREQHHLDSVDKIFVCSHWAASVLESQKNYEVNPHVVPLGVDRDIFYEGIAGEGGPYVFLNIGKWEVRKGHDIIVDAFNNAFNESDNVQLWMMNHNPFLKPEKQKEWEDFYTQSRLGSKIHILPRVQTQEELAAIMRKANCGVFPARAEGWNLELLEMMSCGKQVIATDYSAHTEFCNADNCHLIPVTDLEDAYDGIWFNGQGQWAKFDDKTLDKLSSLMLQCYKKGDLVNHTGIETAKEFSWDNTVKAIQKGL